MSGEAVCNPASVKSLLNTREVTARSRAQSLQGHFASVGDMFRSVLRRKGAGALFR